MADNNEIDSLKLGIEVGDLSSSDIKNIKDLSSSLAALDKVLSSEFMKNLETLSHLKINVNVSELKQAAKQVQKAVAPTSTSGTIFGDGVDVADITEEKTYIGGPRNAHRFHNQTILHRGNRHVGSVHLW